MPIYIIQLVSLNVSISIFVDAVRRSDTKPLTLAEVIRWIVTPTILSQETLHQSWDMLLILPATTPALPLQVRRMIRESWTVQAGIPSKLLSSYSATNSQLLHPSPDSVPELTSTPSDLNLVDSPQNLELTPELKDWIQQDQGPQGAVSMLNLLAFKPGKKEQYMKYGQAFSESVGKRRGGIAKLVGKIIPNTCSDGSNGWDEVCPPPLFTPVKISEVLIPHSLKQMALAHYPSLRHFADMIGSEDYQQANHEWRIPSLKDTCIVCTTELDTDREERKAKL